MRIRKRDTFNYGSRQGSRSCNSVPQRKDDRHIYRVPTADVSVVDLNVVLEKPATYEEICMEVKKASETYMKGVIEYVDDEVVSGDFVETRVLPYSTREKELS